MDNQAEFQRFLHQMGKKDHVIEGLIQNCERFENYLQDQGAKALDQANHDDLDNFVADLGQHGQDPKNTLRGLALYYKFSGNQTLACQANELREARIAAIRKKFNLREFRGLDPADLDRLETLGIRNTEQMLAAGRTSSAREALAKQSGLPPQLILECVKLSDLARIEGVKAVRARLYYDAGLDSLDKLASSDPDRLRPYLEEFVERTHFDGIAPLPKELHFTVRRAQELEKIIEYD